MAGLQSNIYASIGVTWIAALAALVMRVIARHMKHIKWWFDDYFSVLAFAFATAYCAIMIHWTLHWSLGLRMSNGIETATQENLLYHARKLGFFNSLCYAASLGCSKLSILCFYWRIFQFSIIRIPILVMIALSAAWSILRTFMLTFRCVPVQAIWDKTIENATCNIDSDKFFRGTITTHFLLDVIILVLPIIPVVNLHLPPRQKLAVIGFFLIGTIVCVASCIVLVILVRFSPDIKDYLYDYAQFCIWGAVEVNIAIVSGCCPLLRPVIHYICPGLFSTAQFSYPTQSRPSNATKLTTITRKNRERESCENSSTHALADPDSIQLDDYVNNDSEFPAVVHTVICSKSKDWNG